MYNNQNAGRKDTKKLSIYAIEDYNNKINTPKF